MIERPHIPVMMNEVLDALSPQADYVYVDGTFGAGGYSSAILDAAQCKVIAIDRDVNAIRDGQKLIEKFEPRLTLLKGQFGDVGTLVDRQIDGFVLDIGVSSMQLDQAERGFSFMRDGPLDMRMGDGETAADLIARIYEIDLANLIFKYGEDRNSRRIAKVIVAARQEEPIKTTLMLASIIEKAVPRRWGDKIHPATRTFQALRIAVNDELGELERALAASVKILKPGGRLVIVTFHSLEDRIVKNFLKENTDKIAAVNKYSNESHSLEKPFQLIYRKALQATSEESKLNPRARSAKLRAAIRTEVPL
jgi:16S rRNA (cytosine1402-N4)-methyltransferase